MQKSTDILDKLSVNVHYDIIPADRENGWDVILIEEYPETVISYGAIEFLGKDKNYKDCKHVVNYIIVSSPDKDLTVDDLSLQR